MTYLAGQHYIICDICGFKFHSSEIKTRWDGLKVCLDDFEQDHPQKYVRVQPDGQAVPEPRPRPADVFPYVCYIYAAQGYVGLGEVGCMQVGQSLFSFEQALSMAGKTLSFLIEESVYVDVYDDEVYE